MCVTPLIFKVRQHQTCEVCDDASLKYGSKMIWVNWRWVIIVPKGDGAGQMGDDLPVKRFYNLSQWLEVL